MIFLAGGSGDTGTTSNGGGSAGVGEAQKPCLESVDARASSGEYSRYIVGTVKNSCNKQFSYVQISFNLYDAKANQVGSTFANVNNLEPYGTWRFKALIMEDSATRFKQQEITGF